MATTSAQRPNCCLTALSDRSAAQGNSRGFFSTVINDLCTTVVFAKWPLLKTPYISRLRHKLCRSCLECALSSRLAVSKLTQWGQVDWRHSFCRSIWGHSITQPIGQKSDAYLYNPMLNFKNIKSELKSNRQGARTAAVELGMASNVVIGDWDTRSIAVMAKITAPLRLRSTSYRGLLGL